VLHRAHAAGSLLVAALVATTLLPAPIVAQSAAPETPPDIVVTYPVLGALVQDLVGDRATVVVLMANGADPHDWSPSAQDIERVYDADLVVANGLGLEEGLHDALEEAAANGVRVFEATDHVTLRTLGDEQTAGEPSASEAPATGGDHDGLDPHIWVDPIAMAQVVTALGPVVGELGIDVSDRQADLVARLDALDGEVRDILAVVPPERRLLVTGHESMGYFADRYGFQLIGAVIPSLSSQGEVSASQLSGIVALIREHAVPAIFTEIGTPQTIMDAVAGETGMRVVQLPSHTLPADGSYATFIRDIAMAIASALV